MHSPEHQPSKALIQYLQLGIDAWCDEAGSEPKTRDVVAALGMLMSSYVETHCDDEYEKAQLTLAAIEYLRADYVQQLKRRQGSDYLGIGS